MPLAGIAQVRVSQQRHLKTRRQHSTSLLSPKGKRTLGYVIIIIGLILFVVCTTIATIIAMMALWFPQPDIPPDIEYRKKYATILDTDGGERWIINGDYGAGGGGFDPPEEDLGGGGILRDVDGKFQIHYEINMSGEDIAGNYSIKFTLNSESEIFNFTVKEDEIPKLVTFDWDTDIPVSQGYTYKILFLDGWTRSSPRTITKPLIGRWILIIGLPIIPTPLILIGYLLIKKP